jgi:hypothetical protein
MTRQRIISNFATTGKWPDLGEIFERSALSSSDAAGYAISASVTEFLVSRAGKPTFLHFALQGQTLGWDNALWKYYRIRNVGALQSQWQDWTRRGQKESLSQTAPSEAVTSATAKESRPALY